MFSIILVEALTLFILWFQVVTCYPCGSCHHYQPTSTTISGKDAILFCSISVCVQKQQNEVLNLCMQILISLHSMFLRLFSFFCYIVSFLIFFVLFGLKMSFLKFERDQNVFELTSFSSMVNVLPLGIDNFVTIPDKNRDKLGIVQLDFCQRPISFIWRRVNPL